MTFSAVLLAGGESRRMGTNKANLLLDGKPLWERQLDLLREIAPETIYLSLRAAWNPPPIGVQVLLDLPPSRGPLSGLCVALERMKTSHLIALAVDLPCMTSSYLRHLCQSVTEGRGIVPAKLGRFEPLAAIYPREASEVLNDALVSRALALQPLIRQLLKSNRMTPIEVTAAEEGLFRNLNDAADADALKLTRAQEDSNLRPSD